MAPVDPRAQQLQKLRQTVEEFLAPYAAIEDDFLKEVAGERPGDLLVVSGSMSLSAHLAASILALRKALKARK